MRRSEARTGARLGACSKTGVGLVVFCAWTACDPSPRQESKQDVSPPPAPAPEPDPPPPPRAFLQKEWKGAIGLQPEALGSAASSGTSPRKLARESEQKEGATSADGKLDELQGTLTLHVSEMGEVRGELESPFEKARVFGTASMPEGPVRARVHGTWLHGVLFLQRKGELLHGELRVSVERGRASSDSRIYASMVDVR